MTTLKSSSVTALIILINFRVIVEFNHVSYHDMSLTKYRNSKYKTDYTTLKRFACIYEDADF